MNSLKIIFCTISYGLLCALCTDVLMITNDTSSCDNCFTANDLSNFSLMDQVFIEFLPGKHILNRPDTIVFEHVTQVNITGSHSTEVMCTNSSGFVFSFINNLVIFNISFFSCGQRLQSGAALFLQSVPNFLLQNINLIDSTGIGLYVGEMHGVAYIFDSVVSGSWVANVVCEWTSSNNNPINFTVQNLTLTQGGLDLWDNSVSGGMNILLSNVTGNIELGDVIFSNNSGHNGGNLRIVTSPYCQSVSNEYSLNIVLADSMISYGQASRGAGLFYTEELCGCNPTTNFTLNNYISLEVRNTSILNNQATRRGGGMDVSIRDWTRVLFRNLTVSSNHVTSRLSQQLMKLFVGGGLSFQHTGSSQCVRNLPVLSMYECTFERNSAYYGAGVYTLLNRECSGSCYSKDSKVLAFITGLKSRSNHASYGAGVAILIDDTSTLSGLPHQVVVTASHIESNTATTQASGLMISHAGKSFQFRLRDVLFTRNGVANLRETYFGFPSTLFLYQVTIASLVNCTFSLNTGSGVGALMSWIAVAGMLSFYRNSAAVGSGINLVSSYLDIGTEAFLTFQQNHANQVGGAIYAFNDENAPCFYSVSRNNTDVFQFIDNHANLGGSIVYELHLSDCTRFNSDMVSISAMHAVSYIVPQNASLVTSDPYQVCSCQQDASFDCSSTFLSLSVIPGSPVTFSVILTDKNGIATPGFISSITNSTNILASFYPNVNGNSCTEITVLSEVSNLVLVPENYQHYTPAVYQPLNVILSMLLCPLGFHMVQDETRCDCLPFFSTDINLECNALDFTITRLSKVWIGLDERGDLSVYKTCPFNYCLAGRVELHHTDNNNNSLCISGRTGRLCGECEKNLSLTLGVDSCANCTSNYFVALFLAFGGLGVLLLILVTLLNLTITEGAINGVIFSLAFLHLNRSSLFVEYSNSNVFVILISWINLDFGINVCFYHDLTPYGKIWLQFVFPIYLYIIEAIIIFTSYKSSKLARITGARNRLKVMSTIFILGYMKILRAVITVLPSASISFPRDPEESTSVWLYDGSIEYLGSQHAPLFVVAVLFLAFISLPYNSYFLLFQVLDRCCPKFPCQPKRNVIMDAHVGAFKEKCRFWLGLLLFTYTILVTLYFFTGGDRDINLTALTVACSFLLLLKIWLRGVYKNKILDYLESAQVFIVLMISAVSLQLYGAYARNIVLYLMLTVMFISITVTIVYHLYRVCTTEDSTVCADLTKCWSKPRRKTDPWRNDYDKLYSELSQHDFETEYADALQLLPVQGNEDTIDPKFEPDLYPSNWFATPYPVPHFREHPDLLKTNDSVPNTSLSSNSSEKSSIPDVIKIRSSMLIVDKTEDDVDASLVPCSSNDSLRSQRLSVDVSGNRTYVIENHSEKKDEKPTISSVKHEDNCDSSTALKLLKEEDGKKGVLRLPSRELSYSKTTKRSPICHPPMKYTHHERHSPISRSVIPPKTRRICRRPPPGTVCFKCDPSLPLQTKIRRFKVDRNGGKYTINSHDVSLTVPSSAIKEDDATIIDMEVGLMLNGPFVFPPHVRPISPIAWICIRNKASLCKPIDITLPHFLNISNQDDAKKLGVRFMKASHHARVLEDGKKRFIFDRIGNDTTTKFSSRVGKLQTHHLCFLCIAASESKELYKRASYCLIRVDPFTWNFSTRKREIFFIVTYNMNACLRVSDQLY